RKRSLLAKLHARYFGRIDQRNVYTWNGLKVGPIEEQILTWLDKYQGQLVQEDELLSKLWPFDTPHFLYKGSREDRRALRQRLCVRVGKLNGKLAYLGLGYHINRIRLADKRAYLRLEKNPIKTSLVAVANEFCSR